MIDFIAFETQFVDHLAPIYLALPPKQRGDFITHRSLHSRVTWWGIPAVGMTIESERPIVTASYGDHKRARRFGRRMIARVEHGAGQSYFGDPKFGPIASYAGGRDCADLGLMLCPNEYSAQRWRASYPRMRVEVVGCPKLDTLPAKEPGTPTVAVSFHFDINIIPETRSAFPAFRPHLAELARRHHVIGHAHPKTITNIWQHYRRLDIEVVPDFADVCRQADLYAVDNSSTLFEFAATGRPVVVLNDPGFRRHVQHGGRFWDWADVGLQVDDPASLADTVDRALVEDHGAQREAVLASVYPYRMGAAQRAADAVLDWAGMASEVAA